MGRPAKSQALHDLHGTRAQSSAADPHIPAGRAKIPKDFRAEPELIEWFKELDKLQTERGVNSRGDGELYRLYSFTRERHRRNIALLRLEGEVVEYMRLDSHGVQVPSVQTNIRLAIVTQAEKQMVQILSQLGLSTTTKDKARRTVDNSPELNENGIDPNSMAALRPDLFGGPKLEPKQPVQFTIPQIDEEANVDDETEASKEV
jgi:hypothetical protein